MRLGRLLRGKWLRRLVSAAIHECAVDDDLKRRYPTALIRSGATIDGPVTLGQGVMVSSGVVLSGPISVGRGSFFNGPSWIRATKAPISIGAFCSLSHQLMMVASNHPMSTPSTFKTNHGAFAEVFRGVRDVSGPISIGSDVWIGNGCTVVPGVNIGDGAVIAAGAVVTKDVPPFAVYGGVPAKPIRMRFPAHIVAWLRELKWWEWSNEQLHRNRSFFETDLSGCSPDALCDIAARLA